MHSVKLRNCTASTSLQDTLFNLLPLRQKGAAVEDGTEKARITFPPELVLLFVAMIFSLGEGFL